MSEKQNNFGVPDGYFEKSSQSIFNKIEWQEEHKEYPKLLKYRNIGVFGVPENYFDQSEHKLEMLAYEKLASFNKQNSFSVPENYFEENKTHISAALKQEAKVISLFSRRNMYAIAALLVLALGFWIYASYVKTSVNTLEDCNTLACIDKGDLLKSNTEMLDNDDLYDMADLSELEQRLNSTQQEDNTNEDFE